MIFPNHTVTNNLRPDIFIGSDYNGMFFIIELTACFDNKTRRCSKVKEKLVVNVGDTGRNILWHDCSGQVSSHGIVGESMYPAVVDQ